jgi:signal transduction histidine kinase
MHPLDFFAGEERARVETAIADVFALGESSVEATFIDRDGRGRPYFFTGRRVVLDGRTHLIGVGIDVSALKEAEAADRIKSAFLANMSHELRTPLNSIIGFTGIILKGLAGPLNAEQSKQLGMVQASARHLLALVNDVLDISKIEAGQLEVARHPFDLGRSLDKVIALVSPQAAAKSLDLRVERDGTLGEAVGDERRFEQILLNLLSNAIKFTDTGAVTDTAHRRDAGAGTLPTTGPAIQICVADTGNGIRPEDLPSLFQPFRQIDSGLARRHDGTGLGLVICRRLSELMGGEIHADSTWGRGSTFTVALPVGGPSHR